MLFDLCKFQQHQQNYYQKMPTLIQIQYCKNCHLHAWNSRHNEIKYIDFFQQLARKLNQSFLQSSQTHQNSSEPQIKVSQRKPSPDLSLRKNPANDGAMYYNIHTGQPMHFPRLGAFQVYVDGIRIFSKLKSGTWPKIDSLVEKIKGFAQCKENGENVMAFDVDYVDLETKPITNKERYEDIKAIFRVRRNSGKKESDFMHQTSGRKGFRQGDLNRSLDIDKKLNQFNPQTDLLFQQVNIKQQKKSKQWLQKWNLQQKPSQFSKASIYLQQLYPRKRRQLVISKIDSSHILMQNQKGQKISYKKQGKYQDYVIGDQLNSGASSVRASSRHNNRRKLEPLNPEKGKNNAKINNMEKEKYEDLYDQLNLSQQQRQQIEESSKNASSKLNTKQKQKDKSKQQLKQKDAKQKQKSSEKIHQNQKKIKNQATQQKQKQKADPKQKNIKNNSSLLEKQKVKQIKQQENQNEDYEQDYEEEFQKSKEVVDNQKEQQRQKSQENKEEVYSNQFIQEDQKNQDNIQEQEQKIQDNEKFEIQDIEQGQKLNKQDHNVKKIAQNQIKSEQTPIKKQARIKKFQPQQQILQSNQVPQLQPQQQIKQTPEDSQKIDSIVIKKQPEQPIIQKQKQKPKQKLIQKSQQKQVPVLTLFQPLTHYNQQKWHTNYLNGQFVLLKTMEKEIQSMNKQEIKNIDKSQEKTQNGYQLNKQNKVNREANKQISAKYFVHEFQINKWKGVYEHNNFQIIQQNITEIKKDKITNKERYKVQQKEILSKQTTKQGQLIDANYPIIQWQTYTKQQCYHMQLLDASCISVSASKPICQQKYTVKIKIRTNQNQHTNQKPIPIPIANRDGNTIQWQAIYQNQYYKINRITFNSNLDTNTNNCTNNNTSNEKNSNAIFNTNNVEDIGNNKEGVINNK